MALQIMNSDDFRKALPNRYETYATVRSLQRVGWKKYFGPRAGTVWVSLPQGPSRPTFQVVVPEWKGGQGKEWEILRRSYEKVLQLATERHCGALVLPLLTADNPAFPAHIDFKIAVDTIREFLSDQTLDVYLLAYRCNSEVIAARFRDLERYMSLGNSEAAESWSPAPFESSADAFSTFAPPPAPAYSAQYSMDTLSLDDEEAECWDAAEEYAEEDIEEDWEDMAELPRKKAAPARSAFPKRVILDGAPRRRPNKAELEKLLEKTDAGFSETLLKLIDQTGKKDSDIYNKANVSRQHFSKIRNNPNYKPTKPTAIAFAIALELNLQQTEDLIGRAGYRLTTSSQFDLIIMYFIEHRNYNMFDINETLYEFDQSLLGA